MQMRDITLSLLIVVCLRCPRGWSLMCKCNTGENCVDHVCSISPGDLFELFCEMQVGVYHNGSIQGTLFFCVSGLLSQCPEFPDSTVHPDYSIYSSCCTEDFCNECNLPDYLPNHIKPRVPLDSNCNLTFPSSSPSSPLPSSTPSSVAPSLDISPQNTSHPESQPRLPVQLLSAMVGLSCLVLVCLIVAILVILFVWLKRRERHKTGSLDSLPTFEDLMEVTMSSGSGAGQRLLEQRTIARQIKKIEVIGKGRYGEVWLGDWGGESVAVKIFSSQDENSWQREGEIYRTYMLHHEYIAKFIACDKRPYNLGFELWMVMEYHAHGSLLEFLLNHALTSIQAQTFVFSIASGLHYLHLDIQTGEHVKPGIAHRDLKSKNILVKSNMTCCISDFGLAVRHIGSTGQVDIASINPRQGTKRYMAPEVLDGSISFNKFEAYKMVDMYSFGLILWEIARRTGNQIEEYQLPYYQFVSHDPSLDDMRKVVVTEMIRPPLESWWKNDELLSLLSSLMQECWRPNPWARLNALRVKKNLIRKGLEKFEYKNGFTNHTNHTSYA